MKRPMTYELHKCGKNHYALGGRTGCRKGDYTMSGSGPSLCDEDSPRSIKVVAATEDLPGVARLPAELFWSDHYEAWKCHQALTDSDISLADFTRDPDIYTEANMDLQNKMLMLWAARTQADIIRRGFWCEPNAFDDRGKVVSEQRYEELEMNDGGRHFSPGSEDDEEDNWEENHRDPYMLISTSTAGNHVSTYSGTKPKLEDYYAELKKPYVEIVLEVDDNDSNKYADWTPSVTEDGHVIPLAMCKK